MAAHGKTWGKLPKIVPMACREIVTIPTCDSAASWNKPATMPNFSRPDQGLALVHSLFFRTLLLAGFLVAGWAYAGQTVDIYKTEVLVKNQSEAERNAAARASFGELIVRVSGQRSAISHPAIQQALPNAQNYLFGFAYKSTTETLSSDGKNLTATGLQLNFEPRAIEKLLRDAQLPLWPATRPKVLVWLVAKGPAGLRVAAQPADIQAMQMQASYRGLPLVLPQQEAELTANDLWSVNIEKIKAVSLRYKADAILVGRYTPSGSGAIPAASASSNEPIDSSGAPWGSLGPWVGDWQLLHADNIQSFTDETPEAGGLFASAVDRAADYFANQYAIAPSNQGPQAIMLRVRNITSFGAFKEVQRYLDELTMVQRMEVVTVNPEGLLVRLTAEGDTKLLMSTLALGRRLIPAAMSVAPTAAATDIDAEAMAELDQALANETQSGTDSQTLSPPALAHAGTLEDPLIYIWQK